MIGYLRGTLLEKTADAVIVDVSGVGYEVTVPLSSLCALPVVGQEASLYIHTHVREDALRLFGFASRLDRKVFETLISVSNVGPKLAICLLGSLGGSQLCQALSESNTGMLVTIPGVGLRTAERLVVELREKAQKLLSLWEGQESTTLTTGRVARLEASGADAGSESPQGLWDDGTVKSPALSGLNKRLAQRRVLDDLKSALVNLGYKEKQVIDVVLTYETRSKNGEDIVLEQALRDSLKKLSGHVLQNS